MSSCYHIVLSHGCNAQARYPNSYSNRAWPGLAYQFSGFLWLPSSSGAYPTRLEKLLKYQQGVLAPREFKLLQ